MDSFFAFKKNKSVKEINQDNNYDCIEGRNLLNVYHAETIAEVMAILHQKCVNHDFSNLFIGDYLDLPTLTIDGVNYDNHRILVSGFNLYYGVNDTNYLNHIVWTFKDVVLKKRMNDSDNNADGYNSSELKTFLDEVFSPELERAIGINLYPISKIDTNSRSSSFSLMTNIKAFVPHEYEILGHSSREEATMSIFTTWFPIYIRSKFYLNKKYNGIPCRYWLSGTPGAGNTGYYATKTNITDALIVNASNNDIGVSPAFCSC
jgi:hypothetical protein